MKPWMHYVIAFVVFCHGLIYVGIGSVLPGPIPAWKGTSWLLGGAAHRRAATAPRRRPSCDGWRGHPGGISGNCVGRMGTGMVAAIRDRRCSFGDCGVCGVLGRPNHAADRGRRHRRARQPGTGCGRGDFPLTWLSERRGWLCRSAANPRPSTPAPSPVTVRDRQSCPAHPRPIGAPSCLSTSSGARSAARPAIDARRSATEPISTFHSTGTAQASSRTIVSSSLRVSVTRSSSNPFGGRAPARRYGQLGYYVDQLHCGTKCLGEAAGRPGASN